MSFATEFALTLPAPGEASAALQAVQGQKAPAPRAGLYASGEVTVLDDATAKDLLRSWPEEIRGCIPLVSTAFGDLFVWSKAMACVSFLETQTGDLEPIDSDAQWFLDEFLTKPDIRERVLHRQRLGSVIERCGNLGWLECYILEPWESMGGRWETGSCRKGKLATYIDLVGQGQRSVG